MWVYHEMGKCYLELKEFDLAREVGEKAVSLASEIKDMTWYLNSSVLVAQAEGNTLSCQCVGTAQHTAYTQWL